MINCDLELDKMPFETIVDFLEVVSLLYWDDETQFNFSLGSDSDCEYVEPKSIIYLSHNIERTATIAINENGKGVILSGFDRDQVCVTPSELKTAIIQYGMTPDAGN